MEALCLIEIIINNKVAWLVTLYSVNRGPSIMDSQCGLSANFKGKQDPTMHPSIHLVHQPCVSVRVWNQWETKFNFGTTGEKVTILVA